MGNYTSRYNKGLGSFEVNLTLPSGKKIQFYVNSEKDIEREVKEMMRLEVGRYIPEKRRTPSYKQLSSRKRINRAFTNKEVKSFVNGVYIGAIGGSIKSHKISLDELARELIKNTTMSAEFNDYTGNLYNSYQATVVSNGRITNVLSPENPKKGLVFNGKRKGRWSPLLTRRHSISKLGPKLKNGTSIRYLHKYEKYPSEKGYDDLGLKKSISTRGRKSLAKTGKKIKSPQFRVGSMQEGAGDGLIRTAIVLSNNAPYSDAVNLRKSVIKHATSRRVLNKYGGKGANLARVMTKRMLKEAGFNVK